MKWHFTKEDIQIESKWKSLSCVRFFATPLNIQPMEFSMPEYWNRQPIPYPADLPDPGIELEFPALQMDGFFTNWAIREAPQIANKHTKRCLTLLAIRKMQIRTTTAYTDTPMRITKIKNCDNSRFWSRYRETGSLTLCWRKCKLAQPL